MSRFAQARGLAAFIVDLLAHQPLARKYCTSTETSQYWMPGAGNAPNVSSPPSTGRCSTVRHGVRYCTHTEGIIKDFRLNRPKNEPTLPNLRTDGIVPDYQVPVDTHPVFVTSPKSSRRRISCGCQNCGLTTSFIGRQNPNHATSHSPFHIFWVFKKLKN